MSICLRLILAEPVGLAGCVDGADVCDVFCFGEFLLEVDLPHEEQVKQQLFDFLLQPSLTSCDST